MHGFPLRPLNPPDTWRQRSLLARNIVDAAVSMIDTLVRSAATGIPIEEGALPAVTMHRFLHSRRNLDLQYTHGGVFKQNFVALGSCLNRIETIRKTRLALSRQAQRAANEGRNSRPKMRTFDG